MNMKRCFSLLIIFLAVFTASARNKKFYDSKSQIIGISGDTTELLSEGLEAKFFVNDIDFDLSVGNGRRFKQSERKKILFRLNQNNVGKKFLDYLFCYNGHSLSEKLLQERALENVQLMDEELAEIGVLDSKTMLQEDYLPILQHNYIVLRRKRQNKNFWMVLRVGIDKKILEEVFNSWNDMDKYNAIKVPIEYVASGSYKDKDYDARNKLIREISRKISVFGIRGQIVDNHPLVVNIGQKEGVRKGDRIAVYRQYTNNDGENVSKRVAYARAGNVTDSTRMYALSGKAISYKKGDIGVLDFDRGLGFSICGNIVSIKGYTDYLGAMYQGCYRTHFSKNGISTYSLFSFGIYASRNEIKETSAPEFHDGGIEYEGLSTMKDIGLGLGFGKTFFSRVELMPYIKAHYMFTSEEEGDYEDFAKLIRIPVGIRASINLFYPFQLICGAEYSLLTLGADSESNFGDSDMLKSYGAYVGFRIVF